MFKRIEGFIGATAIDLLMGYYHLEFDEDYQKLSTMIMPDGKYAYQRMLMGCCCSGNYF